MNKYKEKNQRFFSPSIFPKSRKGAEKTISIYWFAILVIVAAAVVYMVVSVYGKPYDIRQAESEILSGNIASCMSEGGYLKDGIIGNSAFKNNFLAQCKINLETKDFPDTKGEYYIEVSFYDFDTGNKIGEDISEGNSILKSYCELEGKTQPKCSNHSFYSIDKAQKSYKINILSIVNKVDKNV